MAHTIVSGITMSGKTTICQIYSRQLLAKGKAVVVVDPYRSQRWGSVEFVDSASELVRLLRQHQSVYFFIDESSMTLDRHDTNLYWLATNSRHYGHSGFFICQRVQQIHPNIRKQCINAIMFKCSKTDADLIANDLANPEACTAATLDKLHFIRISGFGNTVKGRVDPVNMRIESR